MTTRMMLRQRSQRWWRITNGGRLKCNESNITRTRVIGTTTTTNQTFESTKRNGMVCSSQEDARTTPHQHDVEHSAFSTSRMISYYNNEEYDQICDSSIKPIVSATTDSSGRLHLNQSYHRAPLHVQSPSLFQHKMVVTPSLQPNYQCRTISSTTPMQSPSVTIWGGAAHMITMFHGTFGLPYWACMSMCNVTVRTALIPMVIKSAHASASFAAVAPEVQFLLSLFQGDLQMLQTDRSLSPKEKPLRRNQLFKALYRNLRSMYKKRNVEPLHFLIPIFVQIPIFFYFSADIRRIINGTDDTLDLARALQHGGFVETFPNWIVDLTEPDPLFLLPMATGALLYLNIELATGKHSLSGETASQANFSKTLKDFFGTIAIFFPYFMSTSPAAVQIYLVTSFTFTLGQGIALRNDSIRGMVGLPSLHAKPPEATLQTMYTILLKETRDTQERVAKGEQDPGIGKGVLQIPQFQTAKPASNKPSSIHVVDDNNKNKESTNIENNILTINNNDNDKPKNNVIPYIPSEMMDAANRGDQNFVHLMTSASATAASGTTVVNGAMTMKEKDKTLKPLNVERLKQKAKQKSKRGGKKSKR